MSVLFWPLNLELQSRIENSVFFPKSTTVCIDWYEMQICNENLKIIEYFCIQFNGSFFVFTVQLHSFCASALFMDNFSLFFLEHCLITIYTFWYMTVGKPEMGPSEIFATLTNRCNAKTVKINRSTVVIIAKSISYFWLCQQDVLYVKEV